MPGREVASFTSEDVVRRRESFLERYRDLVSEEGPIVGVGQGLDKLPKGGTRLALRVYLAHDIPPTDLKELGLPIRRYKGIPVRYSVQGEITFL